MAVLPLLWQFVRMIKPYENETREEFTQRVELIKELSFGIKDVKIVPEELDAIIIGLELKAAGEIFGEYAKKPEQIKIVLKVENVEYGVIAEIPVTYYPIEQLTSRTTMGKIIKRYSEKYGENWKLGLTSSITIVANSKGFWNIKL